MANGGDGGRKARSGDEKTSRGGDETTTTPRPGRPVRGSRTGRPIMALLDLLGRRWALRVLWELRSGGATFRELRERCGGVSPTVLNERLKELREAGVVELSDDSGYRATAAGSALLGALAPLDAWAKSWAKRVSLTGRAGS